MTIQSEVPLHFEKGTERARESERGMLGNKVRRTRKETRNHNYSPSYEKSYDISNYSRLDVKFSLSNMVFLAAKSAQVCSLA